MRVAICTPVYRDPSFWYLSSLSRLLLHTPRERPDVALVPLFVQGSNTARSRSDLTRMALDEGAEFLLWIDADQSFPEWALVRLLSLGLPLVGANVPIRYQPTRPTALKEGAGGLELVWTEPGDAEAGKVEEVARVGLGLFLVGAEVHRAVCNPYFAESPTPENADGSNMSEDVRFFERARAAGFRIHIDHRTSWHVGHIGERRFTHEQALIDRAEWKLRMRTGKGQLRI